MIGKGKFSRFEEVYIENRNLVYTFVLEYVKDPDEVEDIVSAVWLKIFQKEKKLLRGNRKAIQGYLRAVAKTTAIDYIRMKQHDRKICEELYRESTLFPAEEKNESEEKINSEEVRERLRYAVGMLDKEEKLLIYLRFSRMLRTKQIGNILGITDGNVRVRLSRTLKKLRTYYTDCGEEMVNDEK